MPYDAKSQLSWASAEEVRQLKAAGQRSLLLAGSVRSDTHIRFRIGRLRRIALASRGRSQSNPASLMTLLVELPTCVRELRLHGRGSSWRLPSNLQTELHIGRRKARYGTLIGLRLIVPEDAGKAGGAVELLAVHSRISAICSAPTRK